MSKLIETAEQRQLQDLTLEANQFLEVILGLDASEVLLTDESSLSDFCFSGNCSEVLALAQTYRQKVAAWDSWVTKRIQKTYGITLPTVTVSLVWLLNQIQLQRNITVH